VARPGADADAVADGQNAHLHKRISLGCCGNTFRQQHAGERLSAGATMGDGLDTIFTGLF